MDPGMGAAKGRAPASDNATRSSGPRSRLSSLPRRALCSPQRQTILRSAVVAVRTHSLPRMVMAPDGDASGNRLLVQAAPFCRIGTDSIPDTPRELAAPCVLRQAGSCPALFPGGGAPARLDADALAPVA